MESSTPASLRWRDSPVTLYVTSGTQAEVPVGEIQQVVERALVEWGSACHDCTLPTVLVRKLDEWRGAQVDGLNVVALQSAAWCPAKPVTDCYDPGRAAITHQHAALDGTIGSLGEADIELNGAYFEWSIDGEVPGTLSLRAVVTHEIGHFLGLTHSDEPGALMYPHPVDREAALPLIPTRSDVAELQALYPPKPFGSGVVVAALAVVVGLGVLAAALRSLSKPVS